MSKTFADRYFSAARFGKYGKRLRGGFNGAKIPDFFRNLENFPRVSVRSRPFPDPSLEQAVPNLFAILQFQRWIWNWNGTNAILHATTLKVSPGFSEHPQQAQPT